jgi:hypothetical protein
MPFTILKIASNDGAEVIGEFGTQAEADAFVQGLRVEDPDSTFLVEPPPIPPVSNRED